MKYRIFCLGLFALTAIGAAQTSLERIGESLRGLTTTLEELSKSTVLEARDSLSVNEVFLSVIRQNPSILVMTKIGPDGMIRNRVTAAGASRPVASVADERWFAQTMASQQPYSGIMRDAQGGLLVIRAWPLFEPSSPDSRLAGILTAKIDIPKHLAGALKDETAPVLVLYHGASLFKRNWDETGDYAEGSVKLTDAQNLVIRYKTAAASAASTVVAASQTQTPALPAPAAGPDSVAARPPVETGAAEAAPKTKKEPPALSPAPGVASGSASLFTDSILASADLFPSNRRPMAIAVTVVVLALAIGASVYGVAAIRRSRRRRRRNARSSIMVSPGPTSAIVIDREPNGLPAETESLEEITSAERETKQLPAMRELIAESSKKLRELDQETDPILRDQIFHDIQDNLSLWVNSELRQLTQRLDKLAESIRGCEKEGGKSAELQVLRYEIGRIIKEIDTLAKKVPVA